MESLDLGPERRASTPRARVAVAVGVLIVVIISAVTIHHNTQRVPVTDPVPTPVASAPLLPTAPATATPPSPIERWRLRGFLDDQDLELFARSDAQLFRIQTREQLVTATDTPTQHFGGAGIFVIDRHEVIVRGWGSEAGGFRVVDGQPAVDLPAALKKPDNIFAGPPGRLWVTTYRGDRPTTRLTDLQGRPVPAAHGPSTYAADGFLSDGDHGLILSSSGGYYAMDPDGPRRITRGLILGVGASSVLVSDCDARLRCSRYLVDRDTGHRRRVGQPRSATPEVGPCLAAGTTPRCGCGPLTVRSCGSWTWAVGQPSPGWPTTATAMRPH